MSVVVSVVVSVDRHRIYRLLKRFQLVGQISGGKRIAADTSFVELNRAADYHLSVRFCCRELQQLPSVARVSRGMVAAIYRPALIIGIDGRNRRKLVVAGACR